MKIALSEQHPFSGVEWQSVPDLPGVYVIYDREEVIYVGMAGRNGKGCLRNRLRDHASGQIVNMFAQYLFLARAQFESVDRITHPREAKQACRTYIRDHCSFAYQPAEDGDEARSLETYLKENLQPAFNA